MFLLFFSFMLNKFSADPNYWETLAVNELKNPSNKTEKIKIKYVYIGDKVNCSFNLNVNCYKTHFFSQEVS